MTMQSETSKKEAVQRLLSRAYFYMGFRMRTEKEMYTYLSEKATNYGYNSLIVEETMRELREQGYINDLRFVESYVLSFQNTKQKGKSLLKNELFQKGVSEQIIDAYFENNPLNEQELIFTLLQKRWSRYKHLDRIKRFKKAHDFLRRKGFLYDMVKKTIEEMEEKR